MAEYEVHVTVATEKTYAVRVSASTPADACQSVTEQLWEADVTELNYRDVSGWTWVADEVGAAHEVEDVGNE